MSVELNSAQTIVDLIREIEKVTGETHYDLTSAVQALKNGYGQSVGGDSKFKAMVAGTLTEVTAEDLADVTIITSYKFAHMSNLNRVVIPDNVTQLSNNAFYNCPNLGYLQIPISTVIGTNSFYNATKVKRVDFTIGNGTCVDYKSSDYKYTPWYLSAANIETITLPEGMTGIGDRMFNSCTGLKNIDIPDSVMEIGEYAFSNCPGLTEIVLPNTMTSIGGSAFSGTSIIDIELPNNIPEIGTYTFSNCNSLTRIFIPKSVTNINSNAFMNCSALTDIYYGGSETEWASVTLGTGVADMVRPTTIHYNSTGLPE